MSLWSMSPWLATVPAYSLITCIKHSVVKQHISLVQCIMPHCIAQPADNATVSAINPAPFCKPQQQVAMQPQCMHTSMRNCQVMAPLCNFLKLHSCMLLHFARGSDVTQASSLTQAANTNANTCI